MDWNQGDQIGRIFAYWAGVYLGQFFLKIKEIFANFCQLISQFKLGM
jgi:hypothetical protein